MTTAVGTQAFSTAGAGAADDLTRTLVGFARVLRAAGVPASPDRVHQTVTAVGHLDVEDVLRSEVT